MECLRRLFFSIRVIQSLSRPPTTFLSSYNFLLRTLMVASRLSGTRVEIVSRVLAMRTQLQVALSGRQAPRFVMAPSASMAQHVTLTAARSEEHTSELQ